MNLEIGRRTYLLNHRIEHLEKALRSGRRQFFVWVVCLNTASLVAGLILARAIWHLRPRRLRQHPSSVPAFQPENHVENSTDLTRYVGPTREVKPNASLGFEAR